MKGTARYPLQQRRWLPWREAERRSLHERRIQARFSSGRLDLFERKAGRRSGYSSGRVGGLRGLAEDPGDLFVGVEPWVANRQPVIGRL